jgi:hypothetical protein
MRAVACSRFKPADGHEVDSVVFAEGVPAERPQPPTPRLLAPPPEFQAVIAEAVTRTRMDHPVSPGFTRLPSIPEGKKIGQDLIDAAVRENRERQARKELKLDAEAETKAE